MGKIIQDMSHYQVLVDFPLVKSKGQNYVILKVGGSLWIDDMFYQHKAEARASDMHVAGYYWNDPIEDGLQQGKHYVTAVQNEGLAFLEIDFEQWWGNWVKWLAMMRKEIPAKDVPIVPEERLLEVLEEQYDHVASHTDLNVVIYTATWFLNAYCPSAYDFLKNKYTHWADYRYLSAEKIETTWEHLEEIAPIDHPIPGLPTDYPLDKVVLFQYSGDKYTVEGVWQDEKKTKLSAVDLNLWVNKGQTIDTFSKLIGGEVVPPIVVPTFVQSTKFMKTLNVPYVSQLGDGADTYNNDCGAAAVAMLIHGYTDAKPTVNEVHAASGQNTDAYLTSYQLLKALSAYGINASWKISNLANLLADLGSGRPVVTLILYGVLVDAKLTQNVTFRGFHFVTVVGYDVENVYINDPLWTGTGGKEIAVPQGVFNRAWQQAGAIPSQNPAFACIVPTSVLGVPDVLTTNYKVIASILNVRSAPTSDRKNVVGALYYGDVVQIESIDVEGWGKMLNETKYVCMTWLVKV